MSIGPMTHLETSPRSDAPVTLASALVERDEAVMSPSYTRPYPFVMGRGRGVRVWDVDGVEFLDMTAGIAVTATGHCHPRVVAAIQEQAERFLHMSGTDFYYEPEIALAERLIAITPGMFEKRVFFTNSGAEAIEAAFKLARYTTRRPYTLAFHGAFHGRTMGALSLTGSKSQQRARFGPLVPGVVHAPYPDPYRPPFGGPPDAAGRSVLKYIESEIFGRVVPPDEVAAVFIEPMQGEGGYITPPPDFLPELRALCDRHGIVLVADEVQSGMGRTGRWWAVEHVGVEPDIITSAKGLASGMPLGAIVARSDLMTWKPGSHGTTFGGNPVCCAAALATIDVIESEGLIDNARHMGERFLTGLREMAVRHDSIGDVRGLGLWVAAELVEDRSTKVPDVELRDRVVQEAFRRRMLLLGAGRSAVRFMPGLVIGPDEVDMALERLDESLAAAIDQR